MKIAIIGGGISGIAAARMLQRFNHEVVVFERGPRPGGVWAVAYPEVRLQNVAEHYRLAEFPWPFTPDLHPTREQLLRYMEAAIARFAIDVRTEHEVLASEAVEGGWTLELRAPAGTRRERFDFVVVASGQYTGAPQGLELADRACFTGQVISDREVRDLEVLANKRVAVIGFGKSAVDMASFAAARGSQVAHVFREPRWLIPRHILGVHGSKILFMRASTVMIPAWVHPSAPERLLHAHLGPLVRMFWAMVGGLIRAQTGLHGLWRDPEVRRRMTTLIPTTPVPFEMRSAVAMAPDKYFAQVIRGQIEPHRGEAAGFTPEGLRLADGRELKCDLVVVSTGSRAPQFPFLPKKYRDLLEAEPDGVQLYRHVIHPQVPRMAFAGHNHGFLHVPGVEVAMLWLGAHLRGDLELPPGPQIERQMAAVQRWKRENILFEPSRAGGVNTRFHQYLDVLLADVGVSPYRKRGALAELTAPYTAADYAGIFDEYERSRGSAPRRPLPLAT
ncbi:FAD-dependent oxidoreductase [Nannocystis punicea]|uniref:FAD-dependent oxidoreductase n=1 Tax=Nannocystis punicea TaxID=2995304 RepID=A0ABY7H2S9_9BACT|nr:FAD-dependent oxidoreductase [Nannocystis poenicansa]WAS93410.1 FAD-dependent oxidoreductase [Nannocystis poenicansa]